MGRTYKDEESARRVAWIGKRKREKNFNPSKHTGPSTEWWEDRAERTYLDTNTHVVEYDNEVVM
jgi:hypothetical protein